MLSCNLVLTVPSGGTRISSDLKVFFEPFILTAINTYLMLGRNLFLTMSLVIVNEHKRGTQFLGVRSESRVAKNFIGTCIKLFMGDFETSILIVSI